jgi:hypothetical protein
MCGARLKRYVLGNISVLVTVHPFCSGFLGRERKREGGIVPYPELNDL